MTTDGRRSVTRPVRTGPNHHRGKAFVYVVEGTVARIRAVDLDGTWHDDDRATPTPLAAPWTPPNGSAPKTSLHRYRLRRNLATARTGR